MYIRMFFFVFLDLTPATSHFLKVTAKPPTSVPCLTKCLAWGYLPPLPRVYPTRRKAAQYHLGSRQQEVLLPDGSGSGLVGQPRSHANFARVRTVDMLGYMCFFVFCWVHFLGGSNLSIVQFLDGKSIVFSDWCRSPRFSTRFSLVAFYPIGHRPSHLRIAEKPPLNEVQGRSHIFRYLTPTNFGRVTNPLEPSLDALHWREAGPKGEHAQLPLFLPEVLKPAWRMAASLLVVLVCGASWLFAFWNLF